MMAHIFKMMKILTKNQDVDMKSKDINNLAPTGQFLKSARNVQNLTNFMYNSLAETLVWEYYQILMRSIIF